MFPGTHGLSNPQCRKFLSNIRNILRTDALKFIGSRFIRFQSSLSVMSDEVDYDVEDYDVEENKSKQLEIFRKQLRSGPGLSYFTSTRPRKSKRNLPLKAYKAKPAQPGRFSIPDALLSHHIEHERDVLRDHFGRFHNYLRISLTERCNLRCVYCMPEEGVKLQPPHHILNSDEIVKIAKLFVEFGVDKIRLTGGEPTIRHDLIEIVERIALIDGVNMIGMTTNGISLKHKLHELKESGLTHINISLDTLIDQKFEQITRRNGLRHVLRSIDAALIQGYGGRLKVNCVVARGMNVQELSSFVALTKDRAIDVRFIEWMPFDSNSWNGENFVSYNEMMNLIKIDYPDITRGMDGLNDTSKWWQVPDHVGRVAFITSMSNHFCGSCNRLRITADGSLKTCLFGTDEISLRDFIRLGASQQDLAALISGAVSKKNFALGGHKDMFGIADADNRPMVLIGG
mmetsp:Transcript_27915/g.36309  ORF Transcript_27915/g.36309 Transcript_27915/m.36309 type:complete len:457 (-) Transcript_27915:155-1525(-)